MSRENSPNIPNQQQRTKNPDDGGGTGPQSGPPGTGREGSVTHATTRPIARKSGERAAVDVKPAGGHGNQKRGMTEATGDADKASAAKQGAGAKNPSRQRTRHRDAGRSGMREQSEHVSVFDTPQGDGNYRETPNGAAPQETPE